MASGTRGQAILVLEKIIQELKPKSAELRAEIDEKETKVNNTIGQVVFKNTSVIKVVTAADSARGNRCNVLLMDEYRLLSKRTIDTVLEKFLNYRRMPLYQDLTEQERIAEYSKEKNLKIYLSSAHYKDSWAYNLCEDTFTAMTSGKRKQFVCGFPYQLSLKEGLLDPDQVLDQMVATDFNEIGWMMEMDAMWYGAEDGAFFDMPSITKNRHIKYPMLPDEVSSTVQSPLVRIQPKQNGEIRLLSADIALMASTKNKNDATAIFINQMLPTRAGRYTSNIVYADSCEGLRTEEQALVIRKLFDEYACDYIVLDTNGIGLGVFDSLARDIQDPDTGEIYPALSCCNSPEMAARCTSPDAERVIWSVKASAQFNSDCAVLLREGFRSGRVRLLINEFEAENELSEVKGYSNLNPQERLKLQLPYIHTTLLIDELVKLQHDESGGKIKIYEKAGMRKDRYSSLSYNYYVALQLETKMTRRSFSDVDWTKLCVIKPPSYIGKGTVRRGHEQERSWR